VSSGIAENVINVGVSIDFIEAGTTHVWASKNASPQEQAQLCYLFRSVSPEVLQQRWMFSNDHHNNVPLRRTKHKQVSLIETQNSVKCFMKNGARRQIEQPQSIGAYGLSSGQDDDF